MPLFVFVAIHPGSFLAMPVPRSYGEERSLSGKMFPTLRVIALCISLPCVIVQAVRIRRCSCGGCSAQCRGGSAIEKIVFDAEEEIVVEPEIIVPPPRGHIMASPPENAVAAIAASDGSINFPARSCIKGVGVWLQAVPPTGLPRAMLLSMSFIAAVVWIYLIANELIDAIDAVGLMLSVPPDVMGLVVVRAVRSCARLYRGTPLRVPISSSALTFPLSPPQLASGNSLQDLVTNAATALKGYPEAAMMGCFCAPMFNILIGLGVPLAVVRIKKGSGALLGAPTWPVRITFFAVLCTLVCLTVMAATNRFTRLTRTHGVILVIMWVVVSFMIVLAALFDAEEDGTL